MHRFTTKKGIEFIKKFEGFSSVAYFCPGGHQTIGYGHKLLPNEPYKIVNLKIAEEILMMDLHRIESAIINYINVELNDNQFDALVSFTFNLGPAALQRSGLRQKINYSLYDEAKEEFLKWVYIGSKKLQGLIYRRKAESNLFAGYLN